MHASEIVVTKNVIDRPGEAPMITASSNYVQVLDKGYIRLEGCLASDLDPVNAARVSFDGRSTLHVIGCASLTVMPRGKRALDCDCGAAESGGGSDLSWGDQRLINFLAEHRHGTPFEHSFFRWEVKAPLFVFREWHRHRVGNSYNEQSARYMQLAREFYVPDRELFRIQKGKPGSYYFERDDDDERAARATAAIERSGNAAFDEYEQMLEDGVAKEIARSVLPVGTYSTMWWSNNPRSLMAFLSLRNAPNAQEEIRAYARTAELIAREVIPHTINSFVEHGRRTP